MIIAHLKYDTPTLKACIATCSTWYNIATPHLHRTLTLQGWPSNKRWNRRSNPLASLFKLGLLPFAQQLRLGVSYTAGLRVVPSVFDSQNVQYFRAMANLQDLKIGDLDFSKFPAGLGKYLGHFAPTLRSVALRRPRGSRHRLLDFLRLFPKLDDIEVSYYSPRQDEYEAPDTQLVPINGGLRGKLTLHVFHDEELLEEMVVTFGGMRFTSVDLWWAHGMRLLLDACAGTLETLRLHPLSVDVGEDAAFPSTRFFYPWKKALSLT